MPYITEILTVFDEPVFEISWSLGKLGSSGGNHMTDNDHFTWRINNNLKAKVFFFFQMWPAALVVACCNAKGK